MKQERKSLISLFDESLVLHIVLAIVATAILVLSIFTPVKSHSFYDYECCSGNDCAPVIKTWREEGKPDGEFMETRFGTAWFPFSTKIKHSPDGKMHACANWTNKKPYCVYRPTEG